MKIGNRTNFEFNTHSHFYQQGTTSRAKRVFSKVIKMVTVPRSPGRLQYYLGYVTGKW